MGTSSLPDPASGFSVSPSSCCCSHLLRAEIRPKGFCWPFFLYFCWMDGFLDAGKIKIGINGEFLPESSSSCLVCRVWSLLTGSPCVCVCDFAQVSEGSAGSWPGSRSRARMSSWSPSTTPSSPRTTWYAPRSVAFCSVPWVDLVVYKVLGWV
jgi:hypothetical protein